MNSRLRAGLALIGTLVLGGVAIWLAGEAVTNTGPMPRPEFGWAEFWLHGHQTLIGAGAALFAAWYAGRWVQRQMQHAREVEADRLARESYAARAVLPLALSSVSHYASDCLRALRALTSPGVSVLGSARPFSFQIPAVPDDAVEALQQAVRFSEAKIAKELADILSRFQIQRARLLSLQNDLAAPGSRVITEHTIHDAMYDAAQLYALAGRWFAFGRRSEEGDLARAAGDEIRSALRTNGLYDEKEPELFELIGLYERAGQQIHKE